MIEDHTTPGPRAPYADVGEEILLLERARLVVGSEWRHRLGDLKGIHVASCRVRLYVLFPGRLGLDVGLLGVPSIQCAHSSAGVACAIWVDEEGLESPPDLRSTDIRLKSDICNKPLTTCP